jgi:hypothetical protein
MENDCWWLAPKPLPVVRITAEDIRLMIHPEDPTTFTQVGRFQRESNRDQFRILEHSPRIVEEE